MAITTPLSPSQARTLLSCLEEKHAKSSRPRRVVSFDETANHSYTNTQWSAEDCRQHWYTKLDYQQIKEYTTALVKQLCKSEGRQRHNPDSYRNVLVRVCDACAAAVPPETSSTHTDFVLSHDDQASLTQLVGKAQSRAGLETIFIRPLAEEKRSRRQQYAATVWAVQRHHKAGRLSTRAELMRLSCQAVSRPSRLLARHMARALEASLQQDCLS